MWVEVECHTSYIPTHRMANQNNRGYTASTLSIAIGNEHNQPTTSRSGNNAKELR